MGFNKRLSKKVAFVAIAFTDGVDEAVAAANMPLRPILCHIQSAGAILSMYCEAKDR